MRARLLLALLPLALLAQDSAKNAPPNPPKPAAPKNEMPADFKDFGPAMSKKESREKIAALEKFIVDHPKSTLVEQARIGILSATIKEWPGDKKRIAALIKSTIAATPKDSRARTEQQIASTLNGENVMLKDAERHASKSVKAFKQAAFVQEQKAGFEKRKQTAPSDQELAKRYLQQLAGRQVTLGEILYKEGKQADAEKLLKLALAANPSLWSAAAKLAAIAQSKNDNAGALDYLVTARLGGYADKDLVQRMEGLYAKVHGDSSESLEEYLDESYRKKFPNPLHEEHYQKTAARTDRAVLAEVFTGSGCPPCVAPDLAFEVALERYARQDVVVLMYHQHIPRPDPMANPATLARAKFYEVRGVPSYAIDGKIAMGGGSRDYTPEFWQRVKPDIEKRLELAPQDHLSVDAKMDGSLVKVKTALDPIKTEAKDLTLQVALVEEQLRYSGENGIRFHPMVVREMGGPEAAGYKLDPAKLQTVEVSFELSKITDGLKKHLDDYEKDKKITFLEKKSQIDRSRLGVVAFVQDDKSKEILQSVYVKVGDAK